MVTSQYWRYMNKKNDTGTERYVTKIRESVEEIRNKHVQPKWQIDFERYGDRAMYEVIKGLYWDRLGDKLNFNLEDGTLAPDMYKLMVQFRKDINVQLDIPIKYNKYR